MNNAANLPADLKEGDYIQTTSYRAGQPMILRRLVMTLTPKFVTLDGHPLTGDEKYNLETGRSTKTGKPFPMLTTDEQRAQIAAIRRRSRMVSVVNNIRASELTDEQLEAIIAIIDSDKLSPEFD